MDFIFKRGLLKKYATLFLAFVCLLDMVSAYIVAFVIYYSRTDLNAIFSLPLVMLASIFSLPVFMFAGGVYRPLRAQTFWVFIKRLSTASVYMIVAFVFYEWAFGLNDSISVSRFLEWLLTTALLILAGRLTIYSFLSLLRAKKFNQRRVAVFSMGQFPQSMLSSLLAKKNTGYTIFSFLHEDASILNDVAIQELHVDLMPADIEAYVKEKKIDEFWIFSNLTSIDKINKILDKLYYVPINIRFFPDISSFRLLNNSVSKIAGFPVINLVDTPMRGYKLFLKNLEDKVLALLILLLISPLFVLIAVLVKLSSPGPIFYRQERATNNGKNFYMLKFRSMPIDAEQVTGAVWCKRNDARPTKIGALLRRTSLDELPQFINVLKGDMSIVGPRPERPVFIDKFKHEIPGYMYKHLMKAGITGWAQINGWRGNTDLTKRIEHDLYYIENWSLLFDFKIIFLTLFKGLINKNAY